MAAGPASSEYQTLAPAWPAPDETSVMVAGLFDQPPGTPNAAVVSGMTSFAVLTTPKPIAWTSSALPALSVE